MADFTFADDAKVGNAGNETSGNNGGKPGSNNGTPSDEGTNPNAANGNSGATGEGIGSFGASEPGAKKRRGRKPYPRDAAGNIIRPDASTTDKGAKDGMGVKNDREKVKSNIVGLHAMAAVLTKQPIMKLNENEAVALTKSLCDVADFHGMNLITAGGAFGLYASLATTAYMIYIPRMIAIKQNKAADNAKPANPGSYNPEEAQPKPKSNFQYDFSADVLH